MIPAAAGRKGEPDLNDIAVQFRHVSMAFPGVLANDDVSQMAARFVQPFSPTPDVKTRQSRPPSAAA